MPTVIDVEFPSVRGRSFLRQIRKRLNQKQSIPLIRIITIRLSASKFLATLLHLQLANAIKYTHSAKAF